MHSAVASCTRILDTVAQLAKVDVVGTLLHVKYNKPRHDCHDRSSHEDAKEGFTTFANTGSVRIIHALIQAGAWHPPDTTWCLSSKVLFWLGCMSLEEFLAAVTLGENMQTEMAASVMHRLYCHDKAQPWIEFAPYYSIGKPDPYDNQVFRGSQSMAQKSDREVLNSPLYVVAHITNKIRIVSLS
jgi:hypothetical protein